MKRILIFTLILLSSVLSLGGASQAIAKEKLTITAKTAVNEPAIKDKMRIAKEQLSTIPKAIAIEPTIKDKMRIAVVDFTVENSNARSFNSGAIADKVASDLVKTGRFDILERSQVQKILKEQNFPQIMINGEYDYKNSVNY